MGKLFIPYTVPKGKIITFPPTFKQSGICIEEGFPHPALSQREDLVSIKPG